jgi:hypothetical protein
VFDKTEGVVLAATQNMHRLLLIGGLAVLGLVALTAALVGHNGPVPRAVAPTVPVATQHAAQAAAPPVTVADRTPQGRAVPPVADAVTWQYLGSYRTRKIRSQYLDATSSGVFIVANVKAINRTGRAESVSASQVHLELGGHDYTPDMNATTALELGGHSTLTATALAPSAAASGWIAFDVSPAVAHASATMCFGRPQAGEHACLALA